MCEFGVVLAVEPPALAGKKNGTRKSEPADELSSFFKFRPLRGFKYYLIGTKMTESCARRFLGQIARYCRGRKGKKRRQTPLIQQMIAAKFADIFLTLSMELENRFILIAGFDGSR